MQLPSSSTQLAIVTFTLFSTFPVQAITLNSSQGTWQSFIGGSEIETFEILGENQVRWGMPAVTNPTLLDKSGLGFTGVGTSSIAVENPFQLGRLRHFNNAVFAGTSVSAAELSIALDFLEFGVTTFDFTLNIDETTNAAPCIYPSIVPCADRISWASATPAQTFFSGGIEYTLQLTGFSNFPGGPTLSQFISQEGGTSETFLFGQLTALTPPEPEPVPEPEPEPVPVPVPEPEPVPVIRQAATSQTTCQFLRRNPNRCRNPNPHRNQCRNRLQNRNRCRKFPNLYRARR